MAAAKPTITDKLDGAGEVKRDRWGRPLIIQPDTDKPVAYTRATTFIKVLDDTFQLTQWAKRRVARGLSVRDDLLLAVQSIPDEYSDIPVAEAKQAKKELNGICEDAMKAAASNRQSTVGTALHKMAERLDRGEKFDIPARAQADLKAYQDATRGFRHYWIEQLLVQDELRVAGTPDRVSNVDGEPVIGDLKTGSIEYGINTIAMQLALYSRSMRYDPATGERQPLSVSQDKGLVIHLPAGQGTCELVWVDLNAGWEAVLLARDVKAWRDRKDISRPYEPRPGFTVADRIAAAETAEDLSRIWQDHRMTWKAEWTELAKARKAELTGVSE